MPIRLFRFLLIIAHKTALGLIINVISASSICACRVGHKSTFALKKIPQPYRVLHKESKYSLAV